MHDKYVVHRDIKPENIWLRNNETKVLLTNFEFSQIFAPADPRAKDSPKRSPRENLWSTNKFEKRQSFCGN